MIMSHDLSEQTQQLSETIYKSADQALEKLSENFIKKISDKIYQELHDSFNCWFASNLEQNFLESVKYEVRGILSEFLSGNVDIMKKVNLLDEYTFDKLHEIRLAIWKAGSKEIEQSIISIQEKRIKDLQEKLSNERRWR